MNTDLISFLKKQSHYTALPLIEEKLELERETIFSDVEELIEQGYSIEFHPYLGLKLIDIPDRLLKHEIRDDLNTRHVGRKLEIYEQLSSTNETAWELIEGDRKIKDGTVVLADSQTRGRGRMGREWHSAPGLGLWMSAILKFHVPPDKVAFITAMASLALANMLQQFIHLPAEIKWPNDVIIRGRKVAGILVEARSDIPDVFVLGIGLNVNQARNDFPENLRDTATSLRLERPGARPLNRVRVLRPLLFYLERVYDLVRKKKWDKLAKAWGEFVHMGGKYVRLSQAAEEFEGTVARVHPSEGITLKIAGKERTFSAESVSNVREVPKPASDRTAQADEADPDKVE